jgi:hypothetical protein
MWMDSGSDKKKDLREITYHVGWKKGKIAWNEGMSAQIPVYSDHLEQTEVAKLQLRLQLLWRAVPALPSAILLPILYALPVLCFILTIVLIYGLGGSS